MVNLKVEFETNCETSIESIEVSYGSKIEQPQTITKRGYRFIDWKLKDIEWLFDQYNV